MVPLDKSCVREVMFCISVVSLKLTIRIQMITSFGRSIDTFNGVLCLYGVPYYKSLNRPLVVKFIPLTGR